MVNDNEFYSVTDLAKALKVSRQAILDRIMRGTLKTIKIGETYAISKAEVKKALAGKGK